MVAVVVVVPFSGIHRRRTMSAADQKGGYDSILERLAANAKKYPDKDAVGFFERCGFHRSVCTSMWIYDGGDH